MREGAAPAAEWPGFLAIDLTPAPRTAHRPEAGPVRAQIVPTGGIGALGPAVGNDILCALTWCAALTMGYAATRRFACIFR